MKQRRTIRILLALALGCSLCLLRGAATAQTEETGQEEAGAAPTADDILRQMDVPPEPVQRLPSGTNAVTWASYREGLCRWYGKTLVANYRKCGHKDAKWDDKIEKYYLLFAPLLARQTEGCKAIPALTNMAAEIAASGCQDPFFDYTRGRLALEQGSYKEAVDRITKCKTPLTLSPYPRFYCFLAVDALQSSFRQLGDESNLKALDNELLYWALKAACDTDFGDGNQRHYLQECLTHQCVSQASWRTQFAIFSEVAMKASVASNSVDPWIAAVAQGKHHIDLAWTARGSGWASEVTETGRKGFRQHLELARKWLTEAHRLHPEFPEAATHMITVSVGSSRLAHEERIWFDRAVAAQFDYIDAYNALKWALLPSWGGSHGRMLALARECLATKRFDTEIPGRYFVIAFEISSELDHWKEVYSWPGVYEDCLAATTGYLAAATYDVRWLKSNMAIIAWAAGHYADADRWLRELEGKLNANNLTQFKVEAADVIGETRAYTGPHAPAIREADAAAKRGQFAEALKVFEDLSSDDTLTPEGRLWVGSRAATLRAKVALDRNEWVDMTPPPNMAGWQQVEGQWSVTSNGTLVGSRDDPGRLRIVWNEKPGWNVEFKGNTIVERGTRSERAVILLACSSEGVQGTGIWVTQNTLSLNNNVSKDRWVVEHPPSVTNSLHAVLWNKKLTVYLNGQKLVDRRAVNDWINGPEIAFEEYRPDTNHSEIRLRNLKIRRLQEAPAEF